MSDSRTETAALLALVIVLGTACQSEAPTVGFPLLAPTARAEPTPPSELDRAVADLTEAALAGSGPDLGPLLARVESLHDGAAMERAREEGRPVMSGLVPLATDLRNSTLDDPVAYREASRELLDSWSLDLDPALEARLEQAVADDPLELASDRTRDHWESIWASTFNAVVEPVGGSLAFGLAIAPFRVANHLTHYAAAMYSRPDMSVPERQALAHRRRYVLQHPDAPDADAVREKVAEGQQQLDAMQAEHYAAQARLALDAGRYALAERQAVRALRLQPEVEDAAEIRDEARLRRQRLTALRDRSLRAREAPPADERLAPVLEALLASSNLSQVELAGGDERDARRRAERERLERLVTLLRILRDEDGDGPLADEAAYGLALAQYDLGLEDESFRRLHSLAGADPLESNMQRHADALLQDPWQNTYGNFRRQQQRAGSKKAGFRLFGAHALGRSYPDLPFGLSWLVELPGLAQSLVMAPIRLVFGPWDPPGTDFDRPPSVAGYRYLAREPGGTHTREVAEWLYEYETERENWVGALRLYDLQPPGEPTERLLLAEKAADQQLAAAERAGRRDWRGSILRGVARNFPDSDAGLTAGWQLRREIEQASPQRIRVTKSFLLENPDVAGPRGLALSPALLDDDVRNGELHPRGVTFLGGRVLEFALVAESGDEDDEPVLRRQEITSERLAGAVAMLDENVLRNDQLDEADAVKPDAFRDHYLERARLGLVDEPDLRASAESSYVYESLREQYGVVRGRDSILPFDLVFQGSLYDMSLGAFPRWRQPRETPDAFLYK